MNQYCNQINVYISSDVQTIFNGQVFPKTDKKFHVFDVDDFNVETNVSNSSSSLLNSISKKLYTDKVSSDIEKIFASPRSVIIECKVDKGNSLLLGSLEYPAKLTITPNIQLDVINIDWKTPYQISF